MHFISTTDGDPPLKILGIYPLFPNKYLCFTMNNGNVKRSINKRYIARLLFLLNALCVFMYIFKCILRPNDISEVFKTFGIKCLGIVLSCIQVWCK